VLSGDNNGYKRTYCSKMAKNIKISVVLSIYTHVYAVIIDTFDIKYLLEQIMNFEIIVSYLNLEPRIMHTANFLNILEIIFESYAVKKSLLAQKFGRKINCFKNN
jgi:hypothetical protein